MRQMFFLMVLLPFWLAGPIAAKDRAGDFDYYVLSLSWSPNWCAVGDRQISAEQCSKQLGWILHGLWPQYERGWPSKCQTVHAPPSRRMTRNMADIMGSAGLAWHEWKTHGTCSGLSAAAYFTLSRRAYEKFKRPAVFRKIDEPVNLAPKVIEAAFLRDNPALRPDMVTVTCKGGDIGDLRICLDKDLNPRTCGADVIKDCTRPSGRFHPF